MYTYIYIYIYITEREREREIIHKQNNNNIIDNINNITTTDTNESIQAAHMILIHTPGAAAGLLSRPRREPRGSDGALHYIIVLYIVIVYVIVVYQYML